MKNTTELIRTLLATPAVSGREEKIATLLSGALAGTCSLSRGRLGTLVAHRPGSNAKKRLLVVTHMDTPGFFITYHEPDGRLRFTPSDPAISYQAYLGARLICGSVSGVLRCEDGIKPEECKTADLWIDIGATDRAAAEAAVSIGDDFAPAATLTEREGALIGRFVASRALLSVSVTAAKKITPENDVFFAFSPFGCVGGRSGRSLGNSLSPDAAIILREFEAVPGAPLLLARDGRAFSDCALFSDALRLAEEASIPCRPAATDKGASEAATLAVSGRGTPTLSLALPVTAPGTDQETVREDDIAALLALVEQLTEKLL